MAQKNALDREEFVTVKKSDLERIAILLHRLEDQDS